MLRLACTEGTPGAVRAARGAQRHPPKLAGSGEERGLCPHPFLTRTICPPVSQRVTKRTYCLSITWKKSLALVGLFSPPAAPVWSPQGSLTRCLHGGCQLPILLCCHVLAVGGFQGDAFVAPLDVEVAARVPVGQTGQSGGWDGGEPCHHPPAGLERATAGSGEAASICLCRMSRVVVAIPLGSPRPGGRRRAGSQRHFWAFRLALRVELQGKHFDSPSRPGRIMWPQGPPEHRGRQAPTQPWLSQNALPLLGSVWDEHPSWKTPLNSSGRCRGCSEAQAGP